MKRLDMYVRGFRNYFDLGTPLTSADLASLEADRIRQLHLWARGHRLDLSLVLGQTERFLAQESPTPPPGAYGQEESGPREEEAPSPIDSASASPTSLSAVDRRPAAVRKRAAGPRPAAVNAGGLLSIFGHGPVASLDEARLVLRQKQELVFEIPLAALQTVQVDSYGMTLTTPLLEKLAEHDIPVLFARHGEQPWAALRPLASRGPAELLRAQIRAQDAPLALEVARELVGAKLANQGRLLRYYAKYRGRRAAPSGVRLTEAADLIAKLAGSLSTLQGQDLDAARRKVFSIEGRAGAVYWAALRAVPGKLSAPAD